MRIVDMNWMSVADYLSRDDRAVIPPGSTEQHAYLSLGTDAILSERVAVEAAEVKELVGDGNYGGAYHKPNDRMMAICQAGVEETQRIIDGI